MKKDWKAIIDQFEDLHVVVVGDLMLDNYWTGNVERISPEAPVPVVTVSSKESRLGGCANVALNCKALGARVTLAGIVGEDAHGLLLKQLVEKAGIESDLIIPVQDRPTTSKTRILSKHHQMMRLDEEVTEDINTATEHLFIDKVLRYIQTRKPNILIFEDYNKGTLKANVIQKITEHAQRLNIFVAVDPKLKNFLTYKNVNLFKPNLKEVREGLQTLVDPNKIENLSETHDILAKHLNHQITLITLGEFGSFAQEHNETVLIPAHRRNIADVSGAGDTVIATAAMTYYVSKDIESMVLLSNLAGGMVCERVGVVPIDKEELVKETAKL